ncbi:hypothetical protein GWO43_02195 [candidate division KSB1 bacterium]|nr:hypothetical protein [candidate division KSB1 bacterium]NIR69653.1 hypothetical protein [candidate division KSB1 bacterium]NIS22882.1 hypothetical protein [candidate division KSB1 bacterium]NIT69720.1 hypothetical protein [candidate division KSB1 bacterium]NIU23388.1 hypothetical protein [candidate division KSB1 bacterium]
MLRISAFSTFFFLLLGTPLTAQPIWVDTGTNNFVALEILKPNFSSRANTTFATSTIFLSGRFRTSDNAFFVGELPFAHRGFDNGPRIANSETAVGNPYLGMEFHHPDRNTFWEIGIRLPIVPENNSSAKSLGRDSDFDRFEAFLHNFVTVLGKVNFMPESSSNLTPRIRVGPTVLIPIGEPAETADIELFLDYSAQVGYNGQRFGFLAGLTGRLFVSEDELDFSERTFHHLGIAANVAFDNVRPGIHLRLPLDEFITDRVDFIFGVNLAVQLP